MNILLVNDRYFVSGGPERYLFNVTKLLERHGHRVVPFAVGNERNVETPYSRYFLSPLGDGRATYFEDIPKTPATVAKLLGRSFYSFEARRKMESLLRAERIDVAYVLHFLRWLSPSVLSPLRARGIPIVVRLSDYSIICPQALFLREGRICELCKTGNFLHGLRHRCVRGSRAATLVDVSSRYFHRLTGALDGIGAFASPSRFTLSKMREAGYPERMLRHVPTFTEIPVEPPVPPVALGDILYFGRIAIEKGLDVLLSAWRMVGAPRGPAGKRLRIVGPSNRGERERLERRVAGERIEGVEFHPQQEPGTLREMILQALCTVVPSIVYENLPNSVLESFALRRPVIASRLGSLPELVEDERTGLLFEPGDARALAACLSRALDRPEEMRGMGELARALVEREFTPEAHYERLTGLFSEVASNTRRWRAR